VQYADFADWQRQWLRGAVLEEQLDYWRRQLSRLPPSRLPHDRSRPAIRRFQGSTYWYQLPLSLKQSLLAIGRSERATLFMVLLAAFQTLLRGLSGQEDVAVGSPIANRRRLELEGLIGFFVNTLVMRTDLSGNPSFREALGRVREVCLEAYAHQDVPFEKIVEELEPDRDLGREPLFQVMFALQNAPLPEVKALGSVEYDTDLFDRETVIWMARELRSLLERVAVNPDERLADLLSDEEREKMLLEWSGGIPGAE
jgi:non-ribosomal peptide synthetase component F